MWNARAHKYANIKNQGHNVSNAEAVPFASTSASDQVVLNVAVVRYVNMVAEDMYAKSALEKVCVCIYGKSKHVKNAMAHNDAHIEGGNNNVVIALEAHFVSITERKYYARNAMENTLASMKVVLS